MPSKDGRHRHLAAVARFRRSFRSLARGEVARLLSTPGRRGRFDPSGLYEGLVRSLHPLASARLARVRTFEDGRERYRDAATSEVLAAADALAGRLLAFSAAHGPDIPPLEGVAWPELPDHPHLGEAVADASPSLGAAEFLPRFDLALKTFFVLHAHVLPHDDAWYAVYARELDDASFLLLALPEGEVERELGRFLSRLFLVYPFTWAEERELVCLPSRRDAFFSGRYTEGGGRAPCAARPSQGRS